MQFYRYVLKGGHAGKGNHNEIVVYDTAQSYLDAMNRARKFPMVKSKGTMNGIISIKTVDEYEFVVNSLQTAYRNMVNAPNRITKLANLVRRLSYCKGYKFETPEGIALANFCSRYSNADDNAKQSVEDEYETWAIQVINNYENNLTL